MIPLTLVQLRQKIAAIDASIIQKLAERQSLSQKIGQIKADLNLKITDVKQEAKQFATYVALSNSYEISPIFICALFESILLYSKQLQQS
ncbi:MAG: chorismate mutase [Legionellales bacterium]|nr:chorismate mutase [Legionellales bacterium]